MDRNIELGYGTVTKEAMQDKELTIESKAIYAYLCSFAGGKDVAWPSVNKMCFDLCIDIKRLRKHMNILVENEYIEIKKYIMSGSKKFANNKYFILK